MPTPSLTSIFNVTELLIIGEIPGDWALERGFTMIGQYTKFVVSAGGAAVVWLTTYHATAHWEAPVVAAITAVLVFVAPNTPKGP